MKPKAKETQINEIKLVPLTLKRETNGSTSNYSTTISSIKKGYAQRASRAKTRKCEWLQGKYWDCYRLSFELNQGAQSTEVDLI